MTIGMRLIRFGVHSYRKVEIKRVDDFDGLKDRLDGTAAIVVSGTPTEQPWEES